MSRLWLGLGPGLSFMPSFQSLYLHAVGTSCWAKPDGVQDRCVHCSLASASPRGTISRMAIAEKADMAHTIMATRRHCLEMATGLVEPSIDYIIAHSKPMPVFVLTGPVMMFAARPSPARRGSNSRDFNYCFQMATC